MMTRYRDRAVQPGTAMTAHGDGSSTSGAGPVLSATNGQNTKNPLTQKAPYKGGCSAAEPAEAPAARKVAPALRFCRRVSPVLDAAAEPVAEIEDARRAYRAIDRGKNGQADLVDEAGTKEPPS
jgi:hypothetical protein